MSAASLWIGVALVGSALLIGGIPWASILLLALIAHWRRDRSWLWLVLIVPSFVWLFLSRWTGDRRLFFPFTLYLAVYVALAWSAHTWRRGLAGGGIVISLFLVIRVLQHATSGVLTVELAVAAAILATSLILSHLSQRSIRSRLAIQSLASLLAYAGIFL